MHSVAWTSLAWEDYLFWQKADTKIVKRINMLIKDAMRTPFEGRGKPEPLRFDLVGYWSRRINHEHRLVYKFDDSADCIVIVQCRYHY